MPQRAVEHERADEPAGAIAASLAAPRRAWSASRPRRSRRCRARRGRPGNVPVISDVCAGSVSGVRWRPARSAGREPPGRRAPASRGRVAVAAEVIGAQCVDADKQDRARSRACCTPSVLPCKPRSGSPRDGDHHRRLPAHPRYRINDAGTEVVAPGVDSHASFSS